MSRSLKKGPYINLRLLNKIKNLKPGDKTVIKVWDRAATITPEMVGFTIGVHNGKTHVPVYVVENMVGHRLGEFSPTRKFISHGGKMAKSQAGDKPSK
ncbi:MAG: 30S ribosomal protein S19 [Patescibacteria group bacterium]|jgi:small subunit ribosomal protein S19